MADKLICFDWDGTIADSMPLCIGEIRLAMERMGLPRLPESVIRQCNGPTFEQSVAILGIPEGRGQEFLDERHRAEMDLVPTVQRLFPGMKELVASLRGRARVAIVSNGLGDYLALSMRIMGMTDLFDATTCFTPGLNKTQVLARLLEAERPGKAIMIGDRLGDIEAGKANGLLTVCTRFGYGDQSEWDQADICVDTAEEMGAVLDNWLADED